MPKRSTGSTLAYSTYLGGSGSDSGNGIAVDLLGNAYVTGTSHSADFPTANAFQAANAGGSCNDELCPDAFVTKVNPGGTALIYSTFLGGIGDDSGQGIAVDRWGNAYVTGSTYSSDFPTANPFQAANAGGTCPYTPYQVCTDAFVTKLNPAGSAPVYSTYLGGSDDDWGQGIAVDLWGNAYVTGYTYSLDFPEADPCQANVDSSDAFVVKLNPTGSALPYSTCLGGPSEDWGLAIAVDSSGDAYVTGRTWGDFPTVNAFQAVEAGETGYSDAFVTKLNPTGNWLLYSTYLGGSGYDVGQGIAVDSAGNAYVTGWTASQDFPTVNPFQAAHAGGYFDAFVAKFLGPELGSFPPKLAFGRQPLGSTSPLETVTLTNVGGPSLAIASIVASGDFAQSNNCGTDLTASVSCTLRVTFTPSGYGVRTGAVTINDNTAGSPHVIPLQGLGPDFALSAAPVTQTVQAGQRATYTLALTPLAFTGTVALSCEGAPNSSTCLIRPLEVTLNGETTSTAIVTAQILAKGTYHLKLTGALGSLSHSTTVTLIVD